MNGEEQFDLMVKSILENGEEEVPAGLWAGIESELPAESSAGGWLMHFLKKRKKALAAGLALAGALSVSGLFILHNRPEVTGTDAVAMQTLPVQPVQEERPDLQRQNIPEIHTVQTVAEVRPEREVHQAQNAGEVRPSFEGMMPDACLKEPDDRLAAAAAEPQTIPVDGQMPDIAEKDSAVTTGVNLAAAYETNSENMEFPEDKPAGKKAFNWRLTAGANSGGNAASHSSNAGRRATSPQYYFDDNYKINELESESNFYMAPVSAGIGVQFNVLEWLSIGTGVYYTWLYRDFKGEYDYGAAEKYQCDKVYNNQHYIGIPVEIYARFAETGHWKFYAMLGGGFEKCVADKYSFNFYEQKYVFKKTVQGVQWNVNAGVGIQYDITDHVNIYLEPGVRYYFRNYTQPKSIRTLQPLMIGAEIGVRFDVF